MSNTSGLRAAVAANLKRERASRGWTLSELARQSRVAKSSLSHLEAGTGNPSLETLWAIATALEVPFAQLVAVPGSATRLIRRGSGPRIPGDSVDYVATLLSAAPPAVRRDIYWVDGAEVGRTHQSEPHAAGTVEHLVLAGGSALAGLATEPVTLGPGDYLQYPGDQVHTFTALEPDTCGILISEQR